MGKKNSTSTSQVTVPPEVLARYNAVNTKAEAAAATPFQKFGTQPSDFVAQINPQQTAGINNINAAAGSYRPYFDRASNLLDTSTASGMAGTSGAYDTTGKAVLSYDPYLTAATGATTAGMGAADLSGLDINKYLSPYLTQVQGTTAALMNQSNEQAQSGALGRAASSGAFGGDRAGIAAANLNQQNQLAMGKTMADIANQGYGVAANIATGQQAADLAARQANLERLTQGGQQLSNLGLSGANLGLTGAAQQANLAQQGYNIGSGSAAATANLGAQGQALGLQGGQAQIAAGTMQQQTEQAGKDAMINQFMQEKGYPFQVAQYLANIAMGTGAASGSTTTAVQPASFFSDRRLKEDVKRIGKGDNGLPIYKYRYKGEPETHIGFMADEVEKVNPDAVGLHPTGYKTVDYDRATKAEGGVAGPYGSSTGSQPGMDSYVPEINLPQYELMLADPEFLNNARQSFAQQLEAAANLGNSVKDIEGNWQYWSDKWGGEGKEDAVGQGERSRGVATGLARGGPAYMRPDNPQMGARTYLSDTLDAQSDRDDRSNGLAGPAQIPQARTTGQDMADIAKLAMTFFGMNRGGRTGYATRGGVSEEDLRRLRALEAGAATDLLPSGAVPRPSRISRPVTYEPQAPNWKTSPKGDYQYDTNYGMVRDVATGQPISNARYAARNSGEGLPVAQINARDAAIKNIDEQIRQSRSDTFGAAEEARRRFESSAEYAQGSGSSQDPRMQFPQEYGAYQDALGRYNSANAAVMPSSVKGGVGYQPEAMMREAEFRQPLSESVGLGGGGADRMRTGGERQSDAAFRQRALGNEPPLSMYKEYVSPDDAPFFDPNIPETRPAPSGLGLRLLGNEPPASMARMSADDAYIPTPSWAIPVKPTSLSYGLAPAGVGGSGTPLSYSLPADRGPAPLSYGLNPAGVGGSGTPLSYSPTGVVPAATLSSANAPEAPAQAATAAAPTTTGVVVPETPAQGSINGVAGAGKGYTDVILPDGTVERRTGSRNWRNNNPGNIEYGPFAQKHGAVGTDGRFAVFPSYEAGRAAKEALLFNSDGYAGKTIASAISRYAPASDGNDTGGYISSVAAAVGVDPNTPLSELTAPQRKAMLDAMEKVEGGGAGGDGQFVQYSTSPTGVAGPAEVGAPSEQRSGLAAGLGLGNDKAYEDRNTLGKMMYDPETNKLSRNALLSLASGIGATLSSPSQFLLPSLGLGLQGAAGTYAGLEKQAADIKQTEAQALQARMSADASRFIQLTNGQVFVNLGNGQTISLQDYRRNPQAFLTGDPQTDERIRKAAEEAARLYPEAAGGTASAGSQGIMATPQVQSYIGRENQIYDITGQRDMDKATILNAAAAASGARAAIPSLLSQTNAVSQLVSDDATIRSGALAGMQVEAARMANSLLSAASRITGKDYGQIAADGGVAAAQILQKAAIEAGMSSATGFQELQTILSAVPGVELDADANATLMSSIMVASRRAMEYDRFLREYQVADGNDNQLLSGADQAFQDVYGRRFLQEKEVLKDLIRHGSEMPQEWANIPGAKTPMEYLMDPNLIVEAKNEIVKKMLTPEEISAISDANGRINVAQYFGG